MTSGGGGGGDSAHGLCELYWYVMVYKYVPLIDKATRLLIAYIRMKQ